MAQQIDFTQAYGKKSIFGGLSEGIGQGMEIGQKAKDKAREYETQLAQLRQKQQGQNLEDLTKVANIFKEMPEALKPDVYSELVVPAAAKLGAKLPDKYTDQAGTIVDSLNELQDKKNKGLIDDKTYAYGMDKLRIKALQLGDDKGGAVIDKLKTSYETEQNRTENRNLREAQFNQQTDDKTKNRYRNYVLDIEQRDPIIKEMNKQSVSLAQTEQLINLTKEGNTVAASAMGTKMAKSMGEVGMLTESDVRRYITSGQLTRKAGDKLMLMIKGKPTDATLEEIGQIANTLKNTFESRIQPRINGYIESYSKIEGLTPEEFSSNIGMTYKKTETNKPSLKEIFK